MRSCLLVDARKGLTTMSSALSAASKAAKANAVLVLNKIDLITREKLLEISAAFNEAYYLHRHLHGERAQRFAATTICASISRARMPEGPWLYPEDQVADVQLRFLASEITREKLYNRLHENFPMPRRSRPRAGKSARMDRSRSIR